MIGFWCKISIELIWVENYGKMGESHHFWLFPRSSTGTEQKWYRHHFGSCRLWSTGTGSEKSIPVPIAMF